MNFRQIKNKDLLIDKILYPLAAISPFFTAPQFYEVWFKKVTTGVSSLSWFLMGGMSLLWFIHAIKHKDRLLQLNTGLMIFFNFAIFVGVLLFS